MRPNIIIITACTCILLGTITLIIYNWHPVPPPQTLLPAPAPLLTITGIDLHEQDKQQKHDLHLTARTGSFDHQTSIATCTDITAIVKRLADQQQQAHLAIAQAVIQRTNKIITCSGGITGTMGELKLAADRCVYDVNGHTITTATPLTATLGPCTITSPNTIVDLEHETITCSGGVRTEVCLNSPTSDHSRN